MDAATFFFASMRGLSAILLLWDIGVCLLGMDQTLYSTCLHFLCRRRRFLQVQTVANKEAQVAEI